MKEFRPALFFVGKFLAIYFIGNILYGIFVESFNEKPDSITKQVTSQTAFVLTLIGFPTSDEINEQGPTVFLTSGNKTVVSIFEGCNGVNVIIVFAAFIFAYSGPYRHMFWFIPLGIITIHFFNILRITLLYFSAIHASEYFYYFHKYIFTAFLYIVVFILWALWVLKFHDTKDKSALF